MTDVHFLLLVVIFGSWQCISGENLFQPQTITIEESEAEIYFYNSFVPLLHQVSLPKFDVESIKLKYPYRNLNCHTPNFTGNLASTNWDCPLTYNYNKYLDKIVPALTTWKNFNVSSDNSTYKINVTKTEEFCNEIKYHFMKTISYKSNEINAYIRRIKSCPVLGELTHLYNKETFQVLPNDFDKIIQILITQIWPEKLSLQTWNVAFTIYMGIISGFQGSKISNLLADSQRISELISQNKLSTQIISHSTVKKQLEHIQENISKTHHQLSIPIEQIPTYYNLELTDTTLTSDDIYFIRTLVPVKKTDTEYKKLIIGANPFLIENAQQQRQICTFQTLSQDNVFIIEKSSGLIYQTTKENCKENNLCYIPSKTQWPVTHPCIYSLLSNSKQDIIKHCNEFLQCYDLSVGKTFPVIRRVASDKFIVYGHSTYKLFINCHGKPFDQINPNITEGALEITIPCNCQLYFNSDVWHVETSCGNKFDVVNLEPLKWYNETVNNITEEFNVNVTKQENLEEETISENTCCNDNYVILIIFALLFVAGFVWHGLITYFAFQQRQVIIGIMDSDRILTNSKYNTRERIPPFYNLAEM